MNDKSKLGTIGKIALLTVVPQIIMLAAFASVGYWSYKIEYFSLFPTLVAILGSVALLLLCCCAGLFVDMYSPSLFGSRRDSSILSSSAEDNRKVFVYRQGPRSSLTGQRKVYVEERKASGGGNIIIGVIKSLFICAFGTVRFVIEVIRIYLSEERQNEWDESNSELCNNIAAEGIVGFFKLPAICVSVILVGWIFILPTIINLNTSYNPGNIEFNAKEMTDFAYREDVGVEFNVECSVKNGGKGKIRHINAYFYVENERGDIVAEWSDTIKAVSCDPKYDPNWEYNDSGNDELLSEDEEWRYKFYVFVNADKFDVSEFESIDISKLKLYYDLREVRYDNDFFFNYENEEKRVKIEYKIDE